MWLYAVMACVVFLYVAALYWFYGSHTFRPLLVVRELGPTGSGMERYYIQNKTNERVDGVVLSYMEKPDALILNPDVTYHELETEVGYNVALETIPPKTKVFLTSMGAGTFLHHFVRDGKILSSTSYHPKSYLWWDSFILSMARL